MLLRRPNLPAPKLNFIAGVVNGSLYNLVNSLLDPAVVLVVFVSHFTDSNILLGLVGVIRATSWLAPQLWASGYLQNLRRVMPVYRYVSLARGIMMFLLVLSVFTVQNPALLLILFFVLITGEQLVASIAGVTFLDVVGKVIPARRRGVFFSMRLGLGGLLAIGGGLIVRALLDENAPLGFPANFGVIFGLATVLAIIALLAWGVWVKEPPVEPRGPRRGLRAQLRLALEVWREDANYRTYLQARVALVSVLAAATPFITVYAKKGFAVPDETLALYLSITSAMSLVGTVAVGWASARFGNQHMVRVGAGLGALMLCMVVLAGFLGLGGEAAGIYFGVVFALVALRNSATMAPMLALNINVAPEDKRPIYVGFANTVMGIALLLSSLTGALVDLLGFQAFFLLALLPTVFGVWKLRCLTDPAVE